MNLQLILGNDVLLQGNLVFTFLAIAVVIVIIVGVIIFLWSRLREGETLKYEFITIIAHKFRTPLTQIRWLVESLSGSETDPYKKESLGDIKQSGENLIKLTNSLLEITDSDSSATASYVFETLSICELVRSVGESYKKQFHEKNLFFAVTCPAEDIQVKVDRQRIEFVIQSLLENAYAYTSPGKNVEVSVYRDHRKAVVTVTDHGIGIEQKDLPRIFSKFFRSERARRTDTEGFGISLFLVKAVVRRHKGKIEVASPGPDEGATFKLTLKAIL